MPEHDYAVTELLSLVTDAIQLGRKTGMLTVERGAGMSFEQGMIIFVNGQPVRAHIRNLNTAESLAQLSTWRECRFAFLPSLPPDFPWPSSPTTTGAHEVTGPKGSKGSSQLLPMLLPGKTDTHSQQPYSQGSNGMKRPGLPAHLAAIPYRTRQVDESLYWMDQQGFARIYRRLLLLIDGARTVKDLAVLTGRNPDEVHEMLNQLTAAGLINIRSI